MHEAQISKLVADRSAVQREQTIGGLYSPGLGRTETGGVYGGGTEFRGMIQGTGGCRSESWSAISSIGVGSEGSGSLGKEKWSFLGCLEELGQGLPGVGCLMRL
ncbi:calmodulin-binding protein-related [Striga asiatica]|uniref:Calmodulin-binding protein-related n=1 Tax=Striga asiatica TaxID=4170 RepID=A0A5A7PHF0_STRAF|nr:calmodulin-binding protein-related [Striga asiatica]